MTGGAQGRLGLFTLVISAFNTRGAFLCKCIWAPVLSRKFFDPSLRKCRVRSRFFVHIPILHIPQSPPPRRVPKKSRAVLSYSSEGDSRAFSSSSLTGTKLRNSLHHDLFGALQLLKSAYRTGRISASAIAARHIDALISELDVDFGFSDEEEGGKNYVRFCVRTRLNAEPNALNLNTAFRFKVQRGREPNARFSDLEPLSGRLKTQRRSSQGIPDRCKARVKQDTFRYWRCGSWATRAGVTQGLKTLAVNPLPGSWATASVVYAASDSAIDQIVAVICGGNGSRRPSSPIVIDYVASLLPFEIHRSAHIYSPKHLKPDSLSAYTPLPPSVMDAASHLMLANDACARLAEFKRELDRVLGLVNKREKPGIELKELLQRGLHVTARERIAQLVESLESLAVSDAALNRLSATTLELPGIPLVYKAVPNPIYEPKLMPAYLLKVLRTTVPPSKTGFMYEATVDKLACALFTLYLPPTHQFLVQPQHTFRALAPDDLVGLEAEWSVVAAAGDGSSTRLMTSVYCSPLRRLPLRTELDARTQLSGGQKVSGKESFSADLKVNLYPVHPQREVSAKEEDNATPVVLRPRAENVSALPAAARFDQLNRMVLLAKEGLQRPDLSILYQNVPGDPADLSETTICMCENKLRDGPAAIRQLRRYAEKYGRGTPHMRFFAFKLASRGLEVAMFRFAESSKDLVPIVKESDTGVSWYSVCDRFVHAKMCELAAEVQTDKWGFQWAYEETPASGSERSSQEAHED
ncbi:hypothetical protein B0H19DRAFT_1334158 [Mycena capillaripes]|nr:hypothetical protein B0H19DRAFT_1334158 [Mycena capillaripes]